MNDITDQVVEPTDSAILRPTLTKAAAVTKLLSRTRGATMDEIMAQTHWQAYSAPSCRASARRGECC
jgi:hypothetical protein